MCRLLLVLALLFGSLPIRADTPLTTVLVAELAGGKPLFVTSPPADFDRLFVVDQQGTIRIVKSGKLLTDPFLDLSSRLPPEAERGNEQGLLGMAFHPGFADNGSFFVNYTDSGGDTVVERYRISANPDVADPSSGEVILKLEQPFRNHNGGWLGFTPDGYLLVASGDGGGANDPDNRAQDITGELLGKMLRIDVDGDDFPADPERNYAIPPDNPFVGALGDDEIWDYGLRNPWRPSVDRLTGDLYLADVGQGAREEVSVDPAGSGGGLNFGWRCMEGTSCTGSSGCVCGDPGLTLPIHEYSHSGGACSITGGYVYRGCAVPDLAGAYFFADFCSDQIWSLRYDGAQVSDLRERTAELAPGGGRAIASVTSFGEDALGELYVCDRVGEVFRIVPRAHPDCAGVCDDFEDGSLSPVWEIERGSWSESGGALDGSPDSPPGRKIKARLVGAARCGGCGSCRVEARVAAVDAASGSPAKVHVRLLAWYASRQTNVAVTLKPAQDKLVFRQKLETATLRRDAVAVSLAQGVEYTVAVELRDGRFRVYLDGVQLLDVASAVPETPRGTVGFQSRQSGARVAEISVSRSDSG